VGIVEPGRDRYGIVWMEDVGRRGIVKDDCVCDRPAELREIFDVVAFMAEAALAEESMCDNFVDVEFVEDWISILVKA
jgi:hypothetical protein